MMAEMDRKRVILWLSCWHTTLFSSHTSSTKHIGMYPKEWLARILAIADPTSSISVWIVLGQCRAHVLTISGYLQCKKKKKEREIGFQTSSNPHLLPCLSFLKSVAPSENHMHNANSNVDIAVPSTIKS